MLSGQVKNNINRWCFKHHKLLLKRAAYHSSQYGVYGHRPLLDSKEIKVSECYESGKIPTSKFAQLANAYRRIGHIYANVNPLSDENEKRFRSAAELDPLMYGLDMKDKIDNEEFPYWTPEYKHDVEEGVKFLKEIYIDGHSGFEFMHIEDRTERLWIQREIETLRSQWSFSKEEMSKVCIEMLKSQNLDKFLATKFANVKRYGGEGCETMIAAFIQLFNECINHEISHVIVGMAHRGRLNLLTGLLSFPPAQMFQKMKGQPEFPDAIKIGAEHHICGDVLSHLSISTDILNGQLHCSLLPNPSHLEAVNPVAAGKARAKLKDLKCYDYAEEGDFESAQKCPVLCVQVHGDAALAGQGINQETLGFANVPHFRVGGCVHLVINNQVGFTTPQERARSSRYCSDVAKMTSCPVVHVNGDNVEAVCRAVKIAIQYRKTFQKDVFIDLTCFRRWGHNELDDPTMTNPMIYKSIHNRRSIPDCYKDHLISAGIITESEIQETLQKHTEYLSSELKKIGNENIVTEHSDLKGKWKSLQHPKEKVLTVWDTGVAPSLLQYIGVRSVQVPSEDGKDDFELHGQIAKSWKKARTERMTDSNKRLDWATAEALAIGSLLYQGFGVRFCGEDVGRGTFAHRHFMIVDQKTGSIHVPLNNLRPGQAFLEIANSTLSEEAVLGFEYGFSLESPRNLVIWEAQFGDFMNGAQIQIDTMVTSGEAKWLLQSGITMLLPHGMDGAGPEHSSCRIERFLQMTNSSECEAGDGDDVNFQFAFPTTPAQYFHLLRRQMIRDFRKPLVIAGPKALLRLPAATSTFQDLAPGTSFRPVIGDSDVPDLDKVQKIILVTGKHYYFLNDRRKELNLNNVSIIRLESLCPFPSQELVEEIKKYKNLKEVIWSQEEHRNQGAWFFVRPRLENLVGLKRIKYAGRPIHSAPAVGIGKIHQQEIKSILEQAFG